jgi:hypothetical protein
MVELLALRGDGPREAGRTRPYRLCNQLPSQRCRIDARRLPEQAFPMRVCDCVFARSGPLLAINLLFLTLWGFAGIGKFVSGMPEWFPVKFGPTLLGKFPGVAASFWILAALEVVGFALGLVALIRLEFLREPLWLARMLTWSLLTFCMLSFGLWLTNDANGGFQQFCYFSGTVVMLFFTKWASANGVKN